MDAVSALAHEFNQTIGSLHFRLAAAVARAKSAEDRAQKAETENVELKARLATLSPPADGTKE